MAKPLVTQVLWTLGRAGAERMVFDLTRGLCAEGFRVQVIAAGGGGEMERDFSEIGVPVAVGPATRDRRQTLAFLREQVRAARPDVWHTHLGGDVWGGWIARRARLHPWIITAHNDDRHLPLTQVLMRRWAFRRADQVVCVSEVVKNYLRREFGVTETRLTIIRNGIDLAAFPMRGPRHGHDIPRLLSVGRLTPQKNQMMLLRALALVKQPWRLDLVGEGSDRAALQTLASELGILPRIHFAGVVANVADYYRDADLFLFPSAWEGQGLALLEAAACGAPAVASDLTVFRETFDDEAFLFAPPDDPEAWARAITQALGDEALRQAHARRARDIVEREFSLERMVREYAALYRRLLKRR